MIVASWVLGTAVLVRCEARGPEENELTYLLTYLRRAESRELVWQVGMTSRLLACGSWLVARGGVAAWCADRLVWLGMFSAAEF